MHNMSVLLGSFIRIILYTNLPSYVESDDEKRILLNDQTTIPSLLHQYETQLNKYGIALQQVESKMAAMESKMTAMESKMAAMESKMTAIETENAKIKRENENLNASVANLSGKNNNMNVSLEKLSTENNNLKSSLESLRTENNNMTSSLAKLGTENEDMKVSLVNLRSENKIMNDRITTLQSIDQSGIAGGSFYNEKGSGVNALCLPHNPDNGVSINSITSYAGLFATLYGAEYQYNYKNVRIDDDVPCAVCLAKKASTLMMVPAKSSCPASWKTEYTGILTTTFDSQTPSEYTCMDNDPEYIEGTRFNDNNGKLFYPVKTVCGSLPCRPYINGTVVECAICIR